MERVIIQSPRIEVNRMNNLATGGVTVSNGLEVTAGFKPWHSSTHTLLRKEMIEVIKSLLMKRKPNSSQEWRDRLPHAASRIESSLYRNANSVDEYADRMSLPSRLKELAISMSKLAAGQRIITLKPE